MPRKADDGRDERDERDDYDNRADRDEEDNADDYDGPPHYEEEHRGTLILVLGILAIVVCPVLGVAPWLMGSSDLAKMDAGIMDPEGRSLTKAGKIIGIVALCQMLFGMIIAGLYIAGMVAFGVLR